MQSKNKRLGTLQVENLLHVGAHGIMPLTT